MNEKPISRTLNIDTKCVKAKLDEIENQLDRILIKLEKVKQMIKD